MVTVIEKTIMQGTNEDPQFLASVSIESTRANADNVNKLVGDAKYYKERMIKIKNTLFKERGEGRDLKRKHEATLSEFERLQKAYQALELEKEALENSITIMEGEGKDFEDNITELEAQQFATSR